MDKNVIDMLAERAVKARERSYSPYSRFAVGAALLARDGRVFTGANVESASFSPTVCAERVAFFTAVHEGVREFEAIAIVGGPAGEPISSFCPPCGVCRQVMTEFCKGDFTVILYDGANTEVMTLDELFPRRFSL